MKTINLRWIYPHYRHDEFVEVSDEVWEAMRQAQREYRLTLVRLAEAINHLSETQARRIRARYLLGMKVIEIAAIEGVIPSCVGSSIRAGLKNIRKYFEKKKWRVSREWEQWNS
ncbi:hypothetical protein [Blautia luti]|uniref:RNA polymerase sigma factor n=1 Tax=Blautia luti TaxID=89014 RepID=A0A564VGV2_9FIRM|nr:hypothetical protein [Blautia luti]VUX31710.1 Uncharacterised protein [Blautia luti]